MSLLLQFIINNTNPLFKELNVGGPIRVYRCSEVSDLSEGARLALWSMRALATGTREALTVRWKFEHEFGATAGDLFADLTRFMTALNAHCRREISLAPIGCEKLMADERSLVAVLGAAQAEDMECLMAHLRWLLVGGPQSTIVLAAMRLTARLAGLGCPVEFPAAVVSPVKRGTAAANLMAV